MHAPQDFVKRPSNRGRRGRAGSVKSLGEIGGGGGGGRRVRPPLDPPLIHVIQYDLGH